MKKLIKADLTAILELVPIYQPVEDERMEQETDKLLCGGIGDFLFLSRRGLCRLCPIGAAYNRDNFANSDWLAFRGMTLWPILALFLHVEKFVDGRPWGSVTLLDYQAAARDIAIYSPLSPAQRERHIRLVVKRYLTRPQLCSMMEVIQYLKTGR